MVTASNCPLLKPIKIPKYREPNERNAKGSSIAINFHLSGGEETYLQANETSIPSAITRPCASVAHTTHAHYTDSTRAP